MYKVSCYTAKVRETGLACVYGGVGGHVCSGWVGSTAACLAGVGGELSSSPACLPRTPRLPAGHPGVPPRDVPERQAHHALAQVRAAPRCQAGRSHIWLRPSRTLTLHAGWQAPSHHPTHPSTPWCPRSECARLIAKEGHSVMWHTPLGLPVVQPYRRKDRQHVRTLLQVCEGRGAGRRLGPCMAAASCPCTHHVPFPGHLISADSRLLPSATTPHAGPPHAHLHLHPALPAAPGAG